MMMNIILADLYIDQSRLIQPISEDLMNHKNDQVLGYTRREIKIQI
jgi:hypothetical protein